MIYLELIFVFFGSIHHKYTEVSLLNEEFYWCKLFCLNDQCGILLQGVISITVPVPESHPFCAPCLVLKKDALPKIHPSQHTAFQNLASYNREKPIIP
jgi:hypothetical protein